MDHDTNFEMEIHHVRREANQAADYLASMNYSTEEKILYPMDFTLDLREIISKDENQCTFNRM